VAHSTLLLPIAFEFRPRPARWSLKPGRLVPVLAQPATNKLADAWLMREEFFHLKSGDTGQLLRFLNKWGLWTEEPEGWEDPNLSGHPSLRCSVFVDRVWEDKRLFREAVIGSAIDWLKPDYDPDVPETEVGQVNDLFTLVTFRNKYPYHFLRATGCELAIRTTITIDLMRKVKFRICARPDCATPFPIESRHRRAYCCQYCAHLESVRRNRQNPQGPRKRTGS